MPAPALVASDSAMSRYFVRSNVRAKGFRPRAEWAEWDEDVPMIPGIQVDDHEAVETGILDLSGEPIMRAPNPMGFGKDADW